jgi:hypothetical protein
VAQLRHCTVRSSGVRCAAQTMNFKPQQGQVIPMSNKSPFHRQSRYRAIYPPKTSENGPIGPGW